MITLIRHGKMRLDPKRRWRSADLRALIEYYDHAPIEPPKIAIDVEADGALILCSNLRRSQDSAKLFFGRYDRSDALFREAELPDLPALPVRSAKGLLAVARIGWFLGRSKGCESLAAFRARSEKAAESLIAQHTQSGQPIILVGHGFLNRAVAKALCRGGWAGPRKPGARHGSVSRYAPPGTDGLR